MTKKNTLSRDDRVAQSIINLHKYVTEYDEEKMHEAMKVFADTYLVANLDHQNRSFKKEQIETESKKIGINLFKKQKDLSAPLAEQKAQFEREWNEHTTGINEADRVLGQIKMRLKEIEEDIERKTELIKYYKDGRVPAVYIAALYKHQLIHKESLIIFSQAIK